MLNIIEHPLLAHYVNKLEECHNSSKFRLTLSRIASIIATLSTFNFQLKEVGANDGTKRYIFEKKTLVVTIVPTGIFLLSPLLEVIPKAKMGYISYGRKSFRSEGLEETICLLPESVADSTIIIVDYGIITGKTMLIVIPRLVLEGITNFFIVTVFTTPEGIENVISEFLNVFISIPALILSEAVVKIAKHEYIGYLAEINRI